MTVKTGLMAVLVVAGMAALAMAGCNPLPSTQCYVIPTQEFYANPPYLARFSQLEESGTCTAVEPLGHMELGVQSYFVPGASSGQVLLRPARLVDMAEGRVFSAATDPSNDCELGEGCDTCGPTGGPDGGPNACVVVEDPVPRTDPADDGGTLINALGGFPRDPVNGQCAVSNLAGTQQLFEAVTVGLVDGGSQTFPALAVSYQWSDVTVLARAEVAGTAITAQLTYTEGACVRRYSMLAVYPAHLCATDKDCDADPDPEAGLLFGSGISPLLKPRCETSIGYCVPTVDVTKPGLPPL